MAMNDPVNQLKKYADLANLKGSSSTNPTLDKLKEPYLPFFKEAVKSEQQPTTPWTPSSQAPSYAKTTTQWNPSSEAPSYAGTSSMKVPTPVPVPKPLNIPKRTPTKVKLVNGQMVDGYIQDGATYLNDGSRIPAGASVTINGKTYTMPSPKPDAKNMSKAFSDVVSNNNSEIVLAPVGDSTVTPTEQPKAEIKPWTQAYNSEIATKSPTTTQSLTPGIPSATVPKVVTASSPVVSSSYTPGYQTAESAAISPLITRSDVQTYGEGKGIPVEKTADGKPFMNMDNLGNRLALGAGPLTADAANELANTVVPQTSQNQENQTQDNTLLGQVTSTIDKQLKEKQDVLDKQLAEGRIDRDTYTKNQELAFKQTLDEIKNKAFLSEQSLLQSFANRGLLNSGMLLDAMMRSNASINQTMSTAQQKQFNTLANYEQKFKDLQTRIEQKKSDLAAGRTADIEKLYSSLLKEQKELAQTGQKYNTEQAKIYGNMIDSIAEAGYNVTSLVGLQSEALYTGDYKNLIDALNAVSSGKLKLPLTVKAEKESALTQAKTDKIYSDTSGIIYYKGKPLVDDKKQYIRTANDKIAIAKLEQNAQKIAQDAANTSNRLMNSLTTAKIKSETSILLQNLKDISNDKKLQSIALEKGMSGTTELIKSLYTRANSLDRVLTAPFNKDDVAANEAKTRAANEISQIEVSIKSLRDSINSAKVEQSRVLSGKEVQQDNIDFTKQLGSNFLGSAADQRFGGR